MNKDSERVMLTKVKETSFHTGLRARTKQHLTKVQLTSVVITTYYFCP